MTAFNVKQNTNGSLQGTFLHAVDLTNEMLVNNVRFGGRITSADCAGLLDPRLATTHRVIDEISIDELRDVRIQGNVLSPRTVKYIFTAGIWSNGMEIYDDKGGHIQRSDSTKGRSIDTRKLEIDFEIGRRKYASDAPSRLSCIWLAENSESGKAVINSMFRNFYLAQVIVPLALKCAIADASWFEDYDNYPKPEFIENYWTGKAHPKHPLPEILIDGIIEFNSKDREHIRENGLLWSQAPSPN